MSTLERIELMRKGEKLKCPKCENGYISAIGNPKDTTLFECPCGCRIMLTKKVNLFK